MACCDAQDLLDIDPDDCIPGNNFQSVTSSKYDSISSFVETRRYGLGKSKTAACVDSRSRIWFPQGFPVWNRINWYLGALTKSLLRLVGIKLTMIPDLQTRWFTLLLDNIKDKIWTLARKTWSLDKRNQNEDSTLPCYDLDWTPIW